MDLGCFFLDNGKPRIFRLARIPNGLLNTRKMGVKIKNNEEMIDATIEVIDGVMVVSPKYIPNVGDVTAIFNPANKTWMIAIFEGYESFEYLFVYCMINGNDDLVFNVADVDASYGLRPSTEEERQKLFTRLAEEGYEWDAENKQFVKIKWKPTNGKEYFYPAFGSTVFSIGMHVWSDHVVDISLYDKDWCFKTKQECQEFCNKLNEAINQVKP